MPVTLERPTTSGEPRSVAAWRQVTDRAARVGRQGWAQSLHQVTMVPQAVVDLPVLEGESLQGSMHRLMYCMSGLMPTSAEVEDLMFKKMEQLDEPVRALSALFAATLACRRLGEAWASGSVQ